VLMNEGAGHASSPDHFAATGLIDALDGNWHDVTDHLPDSSHLQSISHWR